MADQIPGVENEADHEQLRELRRVFEQAVNENQLDLLLPHLDPEFSVVTYTDKEFSDFAAFKAQWQQTRERLLKGGTYAVKLVPQRSRIFGDLAIARGDSENQLTPAGRRTFHFGSHWTVICRNNDGQWKILRAHSSINPFNNPMMVDAVKRKVTNYVTLAALIGAILGWLGCLIVH